MQAHWQARDKSFVCRDSSSMPCECCATLGQFLVMHWPTADLSSLRCANLLGVMEVFRSVGIYSLCAIHDCDQRCRFRGPGCVVYWSESVKLDWDVWLPAARARVLGSEG